MGFSQAEKRDSRARILLAAARQIRAHGIGSLGVSDVMQAAGLTQGAFYGHFPSKDALVEEAVQTAMEKGRDYVIDHSALDAGAPEKALDAVFDAYLSAEHMAEPAEGCGICSLAADARHGNAAVQVIVAENVRTTAGNLQMLSMGRLNAEGALAALSSIVGAMVLGRAVGDADLREAIRESVRRQLAGVDSTRPARPENPHSET